MKNELQMKNDLLKLSAVASVVLGKVMIALGLTPSITKSQKKQDILVFNGSLLQLNGFTIDAELFHKGNYKAGTELQALGYGIEAFSFIISQDPSLRLKYTEFNALDQVLGGGVVLADKKTWKENHLLIGNIMGVIGNFMIALGKNNRLRKKASSVVDPLETKGAWITTIGMAIILLGEIEKRSRPKTIAIAWSI